jgi:hypothetical protein
VIASTRYMGTASEEKLMWLQEMGERAQSLLARDPGTVSICDMTDEQGLRERLVSRHG